MTVIEFKNKCGRCGGTGTDSNGSDENGNPVSVPCGSCGTTGYVVGALIDITDLQADVTKCLRRLKKIMEKLEVED